jgi:uncharacterized membrane protein YsdA (DUF1294 family)
MSNLVNDNGAVLGGGIGAEEGEQWHKDKIKRDNFK